MPNPATGFLTTDGTFFPSLAQAELHEAILALSDVLKQAHVSPTAFLNVCESHFPAVERYINAYRKAHPQDIGIEPNRHTLTEEEIFERDDDSDGYEDIENDGPIIPEGLPPQTSRAEQRADTILARGTRVPRISGRTAHIIAGAPDADSELQQSLGGSKPVPNIRHRAQPKAVRKPRKGNGARSRKRDA